MRGVTFDASIANVANNSISTHTPHARCDVFEIAVFDFISISTHTPHARCDIQTYKHSTTPISFLLTHLMRGVTPFHFGFSTAIAISTHTPHARCDRFNDSLKRKSVEFLLTHLMRGVTYSLSK